MSPESIASVIAVPLSLTRGYARAAIARGTHAFENTPITKLERVNGKWHAQSGKGVIIADECRFGHQCL